MKKTHALASSIVLALVSNVAFAACGTKDNPCVDYQVHDIKEKITRDITENVTVTFSQDSKDSALRLKSVYSNVVTSGQINSGNVTATSKNDLITTTGKATVDNTAIGNNASFNLVGLNTVLGAVSQRNSGQIHASTTVTRPKVDGDLEISTTAIGNNASIGWDLTTDKVKGSGERDGDLMAFNGNVGKFFGGVGQCNSGNIYATTNYTEDPAKNIQVSTTAIGNNMSFGVKTR
ncbi:MAG: hypothetical protein ACK5NY_05045 [Burkholderiaceae bacterium]